MNAKLYVVGDSTLSSFNDISYYYPRYGYATQLENFFNIEVVNLALSGRSSKSYILENNYKKLLNEIKKGDFLLIGFGHNDEKDDDFIRFSSANESLSKEGSFKYCLYNYYIKPMQERGVTPILSTPVCRFNPEFDYTGNAFHVTSNGDYRKAILDLANDLNITAIDLTIPTRNKILELKDEAKYYYAVTSAKKEDGIITADLSSMDKTHLNIYGAKYISYLFALEISKTNSLLKNYLNELFNEPKRDQDLIANPVFKFIDYNTPNLLNYNPKDCYKCSDGWYGTAFGNLDISPLDDNSGLVAKMIDNKFIVGQYADKLYGRIHASTDAIAYIFKQIDINLNFEFKAKSIIKEYIPAKSAGFGVMLRDDCYINQDSNNFNVASNYIANGFLTSDKATHIIYSRECTTEQNKEFVINEYYKKDDIVTYTLKRLGQLISVSLEYNGIKYEKNYFDFDLAAKDNKYMYLGMFATRGTVCEFTDIEFTITGLAKEA